MDQIHVIGSVILGQFHVQLLPGYAQKPLSNHPPAWYSRAELGDEHDSTERLLAEAVYRYLREWL